MTWFVGVVTALGLSTIVYGAVCLRTGWTLPWARGRVARPRAHGLGAVFIGVPCLVQGLFYFGMVPGPSWEVRFFAANAFMLAGLALVAIGHMGPARKVSQR